MILHSLLLRVFRYLPGLCLPLAAENRLFFATFAVLKTRPLYVMLCGK
jgi:hypothetical protein